MAKVIERIGSVAGRVAQQVASENVASLARSFSGASTADQSVNVQISDQMIKVDQSDGAKDRQR
jgi:hypothetical protein